MELSIEDKEREAENKFKEWLDTHEVPYWYIHQDVETFSPALRKYMARRPDFMILIPNLGFILTDVEYKPPLRKYENFAIDTKETEQYVNLQKYFNFQVWYVFSLLKNSGIAEFFRITDQINSTSKPQICFL